MIWFEETNLWEGKCTVNFFFFFCFSWNKLRGSLYKFVGLWRCQCPESFCVPFMGPYVHLAAMILQVSHVNRFELLMVSDICILLFFLCRSLFVRLQSWVLLWLCKSLFICFFVYFFTIFNRFVWPSLSG
jgi:hypothetical protein